MLLIYIMGVLLILWDLWYVEGCTFESLATLCWIHCDEVQHFICEFIDCLFALLFVSSLFLSFFLFCIQSVETRMTVYTFPGTEQYHRNKGTRMHTERHGNVTNDTEKMFKFTNGTSAKRRSVLHPYKTHFHYVDQSTCA